MPGSDTAPAAGADAAPAAEIRSLLRAGKPSAAAVLAARLIAASFGLDVRSVEFTLDEYSLNSVSGRVHLGAGTVRFFKFHQEESEEAHVGEYYRTGLLDAAGLPVEVPVAVSTAPGRQIALYELRTEPRLADVCLDIERRDGPAARLPVSLLAARRALDAQVGSVLISTLRAPTPASARSAIHQLFHHRLADASGRFPGGRYRDWYLAGPSWDDLAARLWRVNGVLYSSTLAELAERAGRLLAPPALARLPVATAHGDDHQGNIWVLPGAPAGAAAAGGAGTAGGAAGPQLRLFDCAFAGSDIPVLLAPVKATFHNALAHPFWLYHPAEAAERCRIDVTVRDGIIDVTDDAVSPLRREILASVVELVWVPLLRELRDRGQLADGWRDVVRSALFTCPLLVTNLLAASRPEPVRMLGLARAVMAGSEPADGTDLVTRALDEMAP